VGGRGDEARVVAAFRRYLEAEGWTIVLVGVGWADVVAERGSERLVAEAKGHTGASAGLDVDTMFGQLLRRMGTHRATSWAIVVPSRSLPAVLRVFEVTDDNEVREVET